MIPQLRNVLETAPDRDALLECVTAIYVSAFSSGVATALVQRGTPPIIAMATAKNTAAALIADRLAHAELETSLKAALSGIQPGNSMFQRGPL